MGDSMMSQKSEHEEVVETNMRSDDNEGNKDEPSKEEAADFGDFGDYKSDKMGDSMMSQKSEHEEVVETNILQEVVAEIEIKVDRNLLDDQKEGNKDESS